MRAFLPGLVVVLAAIPAVADPGAAIARAREQMAGGECRAAVSTLENALPEAAPIGEDAVGALHFYTAVAYTQCRQEGKAREHLKSFFAVHKGHSSVDPAKFDKRFVELFTEVQNSLERGGPATFDRFYPGFQNAVPSRITPPSMPMWGASSEFQILATDEERDRWGRLRDDLERSEFIDRFWRTRDPITDTEENEFRREMIRRIRFAEQTFPAADERGALTDRGRVFVLLGAPSRVYRQPLQRGQTTFVIRSIRRPLDGQVERWIYFRPQLPGSVPAQQVEFRFITQPGYGEGVMEKEFMALKALEQARKATAPHAE
ncbi:MAG TPA: GWxTD domain-containing protein [Thermoanaerobaculia bacterium]|nr:GWxTD domain-containing protein [Thermoanaerobaculia bacterium]